MVTRTVNRRSELRISSDDINGEREEKYNV
jgi:hypothetical protein